MGSKFIVHLACVVTCARVLLGIIIANGTKKVWIAYVSCIYSNNCFPIFLKVDSMGRSLFCKLLFDYLDEDEIIKEVVMGSTSQRKRHRYIRRNHLAGNERLFLDYFAPSPVFLPTLFHRRFWIRHSLFLHVQSKVEAHDSYFVQKRDSANKLGLSSLQKISATLRMLAYGLSSDFMDEYVWIGETTAFQSLKKFVTVVVDAYSEEYLRNLNNKGIARLLVHGERRGFLGMLGSIDCMHWKWNICPDAWKAQYCSHIHEPTIIWCSSIIWSLDMTCIVWVP